MGRVFLLLNNINFIGGIIMIKVTLKDGSVREFENEIGRASCRERV